MDHILPVLACLALLGSLFSPLANAQIPADKLLQSLKAQDGVAIYDHAKLLDAAEKEQLEEVCRGLRKDKRAALVVVTLPDLQGGTVDDFAVKLFKQWGIGLEKQDNGVLLLIAIEERKARIETGYGVEGILPDGLAGRVLREELFPRFKQKKYQEGVDATVKRLADILHKAEPSNEKEEGLNRNERVMMALFLTIFVAVGSFICGVGMGGKQVAPMFFGLLFAGFPFFIAAVMLFPFAPIFHAVVAIFSAIFGWKVGSGGITTGGGGGWSGPSTTPWTWNSGSSFGGSSSSWSGGGFSSDWGGFSGGSSGGGGASGGW